MLASKLVHDSLCNVDLIATTQMLRDELRKQIGEFDSKFMAVVNARGFGVKKKFASERVAIYHYVPLLAAQTEDITEHIRRATERLKESA
jgi:hypothetical protein